jgi:hypothetical protein
MKTTMTIRIGIRGRLSKRLAAVFDGLAPVPCADGTELIGEVADEAQLHAVLTRIRDLGLELRAVSVERPRPAGPDQGTRSRRDHGAPERSVRPGRSAPREPTGAG